MSMTSGYDDTDYAYREMGFTNMEKQLADTMRENERLREALRFYADGFGMEQELDNGDKAAEALSN